MEDNVYSRLIRARNEIQNNGLKKDATNAFQKYNYFTLDVLVPAVNKACLNQGLVSIIDFNHTEQKATLTVINVDKPEETIKFSMPFIICELKSMSRQQAVQASMTYCRRGLYLISMDIAEFEILDSLSEEDRTEVNHDREAKITLIKTKAKDNRELVMETFKAAEVGSINDLTDEQLDELIAKMK